MHCPCQRWILGNWLERQCLQLSILIRCAHCFGVWLDYSRLAGLRLRVGTRESCFLQGKRRKDSGAKSWMVVHRKGCCCLCPFMWTCTDLQVYSKGFSRKSGRDGKDIDANKRASNHITDLFLFFEARWTAHAAAMDASWSPPCLLSILFDLSIIVSASFLFFVFTFLHCFFVFWHLLSVSQVNGVNIEGLRHSEVVALIRAGDGEVHLLVVDQETDELFHRLGLTVTTNHKKGQILQAQKHTNTHKSISLLSRQNVSCVSLDFLTEVCVEESATESTPPTPSPTTELPTTDPPIINVTLTDSPVTKTSPNSRARGSSASQSSRSSTTQSEISSSDMSIQVRQGVWEQ